MIKKLVRFKQIILKNSFYKNVLILSGGTAISQIIIFVFYPFITRVYSPEDFGVLTAFVSILSIIAAFSSLKFEIAIPLPEDEKDGFHLLIISIFTAIVVSVLILIITLTMGRWISNIIDKHSVIPYLWLLPVGVLGIGIYQSLNYWAIRKEYFSSIAKTKLVQSTFQVIIQLILGILNIKTVGLLIGDVFSRVSGSSTIASITFQKDKYLFENISLQRIKKLLRRYWNFSIISSFSSVMNSIGLNIAPLLIVYFYGSQVGGWFALGQRIIAAPMVLVGNAVSQAYFGKAAKLKNEDFNELKPLFLSTLKRLFFIGIIPTVILVLFGTQIFVLLFGENWRQAGIFVRILVLMFLFQFSIVPLSQTLYILEKQKWMLLWDFTRLTLVLSGIGVSIYAHFSNINMIVTYSLTMTVSYLFLLFLIFRAVSTNRPEQVLSRRSDN